MSRPKLPYVSWRTCRISAGCITATALAASMRPVQHEVRRSRVWCAGRAGGVFALVVGGCPW